MNRDIQKAIEEVKTAEIKYFSYQESSFYKHKSDKSTYYPQTKYTMVKKHKMHYKMCPLYKKYY
ncbi:hypothetical protein COE51_14800 [Bacillus pseudomycoides]|nr:hypothetical protein COE51_14800 [Bacillus pseudomycoides]